MAVCHGIIAEEEGDNINFSSSSPDEIALANFAKMCGYEFRGKTPENKIIIRTKDGESQIKLIYEFEFTSKRKRQSVLCQESDGSYTLYTKGADNVILERARPAQLET